MFLLPLSDKQIVKRIKSKYENRQDKVLKYIFHELGWKNAVVKMVQNSGGDHQDGQEVAQEALIAFYKNVRKDQFKIKSSLKSYFLGIAKKKWYKQVNKKNRKDLLSKMTVSELGGSDVEESFIARERAENFKKILRKLGEQCQEVLRLYMLDYSMKEIAKLRAFKNADVAKKTTYRCREKLRKLLNGKPSLKAMIY